MTVLAVGSPMPDLAVLGAGERATSLAELWRERVMVLVFLRHFG